MQMGHLRVGNLEPHSGHRRKSAVTRRGFDKGSIRLPEGALGL